MSLSEEPFAGDANACPALDALCSNLAARLRAVERRKRVRRPKDQEAYDWTLNQVVRGIAIIALNRIENSQGLKVPYSKAAYTGSKGSVTASRTIRDGLEALGLIRVRRGFHAHGVGQKAKRTCLIPTPEFVSEIKASRVRPADLRTERQLIQARRFIGGVGEVPYEIAASRGVLSTVNRAIAAAEIDLPEDAWQRISAEVVEGRVGGKRERYRRHAGDLSRVSLYRSFKGSWDRGGRIYGGFWMDLPKAERAHLTINGSPTVELDFARLHPSILYGREGLVLDFDPYKVPGFEGVDRALGKRTLSRLLNGDWKGKQKINPLSCEPQDREFIADRPTFRAYVAAMRENLSSIARHFGTCVGPQLQRTDSDIAIEVLDRTSKSGVLVLPIHDSFICLRQHGDRLEGIMKEAAYSIIGFDISIRGG